jgi:uncharacterized protein (TIGR00369 family)
VNRHLGFRLEARSPKEVVVSMEVSPQHLQETGRLHGGILAAMADTAAVYSFIPELGEGEIVTSIEFKMNFLRPVLPDLGRVRAHSRIVRRGRRIALCDVEVTQADRLVAKGSFTYLFLERA